MCPFALAFAWMKLIREYVSLYVRKYVLLPPLAPDDIIKSSGYGRYKILTVDLLTFSKQDMGFIFAGFLVGIAELRKNKK